MAGEKEERGKAKIKGGRKKEMERNEMRREEKRREKEKKGNRKNKREVDAIERYLHLLTRETLFLMVRMDIPPFLYLFFLRVIAVNRSLVV